MGGDEVDSMSIWLICIQDSNSCLGFDIDIDILGMVGVVYPVIGMVDVFC